MLFYFNLEIMHFEAYISFTLLSPILSIFTILFLLYFLPLFDPLVSLAPGSPWPSMKGPEPRELFGQLPGQIPGGYRVAPEMAHHVFEDRKGITFGGSGG